MIVLVEEIIITYNIRAEEIDPEIHHHKSILI